MYCAVGYPQTGYIRSQFPGVDTALDSLLNPRRVRLLLLFYSFQATQLVFPRTLENTVKGILLQKENKMLIFRRPAEFEFSRSSSEHYDTASKPSGYSSVIAIVIARCWIIWITMLSPGCFSHSAGEKWTFPLKESDHKNKQVIYIHI